MNHSFPLLTAMDFPFHMRVLTPAVESFRAFGFSISFDTKGNFLYIVTCAGVVKLVDARDSKSRGPQAHVGSIPTSGTI